MPNSILSRFLFLPETDFVQGFWKKGNCFFEAKKRRLLEVCPKCAHPSDVTYDHRYVRVKDLPADHQLRALEREAVLVSLENLMTFPFVRAAVEAEEMTLHGLWNDISAGGLEHYDPETRAFVAL